MPLPLLGENELTIYLLLSEFDKYLDLDLLDHNELQRTKAFKFEQDRNLYIAAHVFLRQVLSRYIGISPQDWRFVCNSYGKPAIANSGCQSLQFNLSHTKAGIACALSRDLAVGIDIEQHKELSNLAALCTSVFSRSETEFILAAPNKVAREQRFFMSWTLKEAYCKARGIGFSLPLQEFSILPGDRKTWNLHCSPNFDDAQKWVFNATTIEEKHYLAYCVQSEWSANHELRVEIINVNSFCNSSRNISVLMTATSC